MIFELEAVFSTVAREGVAGFVPHLPGLPHGGLSRNFLPSDHGPAWMSVFASGNLKRLLNETMGILKWREL